MGTDNVSPAVVLSHRQCLDRLGQRSVGRIALSMDALPVILPVEYAVVDGSILIPTTEGSRLDAAATGAVVAFQVDAEEPVGGGWWSVLLQGVATLVTGPEGRPHRAVLGANPWTASTSHLLRVRTDNMTGRLFRGLAVRNPLPDA